MTSRRQRREVVVVDEGDEVDREVRNKLTVFS